MVVAGNGNSAPDSDSDSDSDTRLKAGESDKKAATDLSLSLPPAPLLIFVEKQTSLENKPMCSDLSRLGCQVDTSCYLLHFIWGGLVRLKYLKNVVGVPFLGTAAPSQACTHCGAEFESRSPCFHIHI